MITHQMEVVKEVCDRVAVIENGEIIEEGSMIYVFTDPQKPTTKDFVKSINNVENRFCCLRVQCRGCFITQQYFRIAGQSTGNTDTLFLTA